MIQQPQSNGIDNAPRSAPPDGELRWGSDADAELLGYESARDAILDPRGWTVRCTPHRRTVAITLADGRRVFVKHRSRRPVDAAVEWWALGCLQGLGLAAPRPLFLARSGADTVLGIDEVPGRPADAVIREALASGDRVAEQFVRGPLATAIRALHGAGYFYRDLYLNHLFVTDLESAPAFIDAERLIRPRDPSRWLVKDLAGILSSWPADEMPVDPLLESCGAVDRRVEIVAKAQRIRHHQPKYG